MTVKRSLILSHIAVCILPFLMTLFVIISSFCGLYMYAKSGNHVMAESDFQFHVASNVIRTAVFHNLRHGEAPDDDHWVMDIMDPVQTYVVLYRDGAVVYRYGNDGMQAEVDDLRQKKVQEELDLSEKGGTYSRTRLGHYNFLERNQVQGHTYHLYVMAHKPTARSDAAIETAFRNSNRFIVISLILFILLVSYVLAKFITGRILKPLKELQRGAEAVQDGNLMVQLAHEGNDEFTPALDAFNLMTRKLRESLQQREQAEERRKELIVSISHDIRTPLTSIKAYVEGLLDHVANTPEKQERYLRVIEKKADVLERMIEQLLLLTKMDLGDKALPLEPLQLEELTADFIEENRLAWAKKGARFHMELAENVPVLGSALLLGRVIENVVTNSIKYKTEEKVHISISLKKEGNTAVLTMADDGQGVPAEELSRLQEAFYRTDKARSRTENGSGLGLAIVRRAALLMKGEVEIENACPHGLVVRVRLPILSDQWSVISN